MRPIILLYLLLFASTIHAQQSSPSIADTVDSLLNEAYSFQQENDTVNTEIKVREVQKYLESLNEDFQAYRGLIHLFQSYYSYDPAQRKGYRNEAIRLIKGTGKILADQFSLGMYNVMQLHYKSKRMKDWLPVDTAFSQEIYPDRDRNRLRYAVLDYANEALAKKNYTLSKQLGTYAYYVLMYHNSSLPMDKLSLMYADWMVFKADFDQWLELPFEFRYSGEFTKHTLTGYNKYYTQEHIELRDKDYKSIFLELISRMKELTKEMVVDNGYDKKNVDRDLRRGYYTIYLSIINSFYKWALSENKEGQVILPLKQFINQDVILNELDSAFKYKVTPAITGYEYVDLVRNLANVYHQLANGLDEKQTIFSAYEYFINKEVFTEKELDYALFSIGKDKVRVERLLNNYPASISSSQDSKKFTKLPDTVIINNLGKWEIYMDARIQEVYTYLENNQIKEAKDSLSLLLDNIKPLDDGTEDALVYKTQAWPHLQYLIATIQAQNGKWMTELLEESLRDIEKQSPLPEIYYPVHLLYFKSVYQKDKKILDKVLSNLLFYTGRQLRYTFMMLTAEERMLLYEKKLNAFFDVYHELLFRGHLDKFPELKEKVIAQSLSLKNSLADGNLIPNELFVQKKDKTSEDFIEGVRSLRQEVNLILLNQKMEYSFATTTSLLKDRVQGMWLNLLMKSGMDSLVKLASWKSISGKLKPGQVFTETVRYRRWLSDSSAYYGAYVIMPGGKLKILELCPEAKMDKLLKDPGSSPQTASLKTDGNRGGQVTNTAETVTGDFKKGSVDLLGSLILKPLWPYIANQKEWILVQDGLLNRISMASLQWKFKNIFEYLQLRQLSGSNSLFQPASILPKNSKVLLAGGLDYGTTVYQTSNRLFKSQYSWNYLPGTKKELEKLQPIFKSNGFEVKTIGGNNFPDSMVQLLSGYQVVHLATHGFYLDSTGADKIYSAKWNRMSVKNEPLFRSGIVISNANQPDSANYRANGYFLGYELANTDLRKCFLVTLSACETGLGDLRNNLGVDGLSRALKIGGARHLLISLWKVPDQPTAIFMEQFYKNLLSGKPPAQALRLTQGFMSRSYKTKDWAAFVLVE